ncbi:MAG: carboxypeptidase M32, partial [Anaerolineales bacterium]
MEKKIEQLKTILSEISDLSYTAALLGWDQQTYMPPGGAEARGNQLALLGRLVHERVTSPELGKLLDELKPYAASLDPNLDDARLVKVTARGYEKAIRVPTKHVVEFSQATTLGQQAWVEARAKSNFSIFRPHLEKIVALRQEYASFFPNFEHPYDALLDDFEPNMKTADVKTIFDGLRPKQVELIKAIA